MALFGRRMSVELRRVPVSHKSEKQVLTDLLTALETKSPIAGVTRALIDRARHQFRL